MFFCIEIPFFPNLWLENEQSDNMESLKIYDHEIYILDHEDDIQEYAKTFPDFFSCSQLDLKIGTVWLGLLITNSINLCVQKTLFTFI